MFEHSKCIKKAFQLKGDMQSCTLEEAINNFQEDTVSAQVVVCFSSQTGSHTKKWKTFFKHAKVKRWFLCAPVDENLSSEDLQSLLSDRAFFSQGSEEKRKQVCSFFEKKIFQEKIHALLNYLANLKVRWRKKVFFKTGEGSEFKVLFEKKIKARWYFVWCVLITSMLYWNHRSSDELKMIQSKARQQQSDAWHESRHQSIHRLWRLRHEVYQKTQGKWRLYSFKSILELIESRLEMQMQKSLTPVFHAFLTETSSKQDALNCLMIQLMLSFPQHMQPRWVSAPLTNAWHQSAHLEETSQYWEYQVVCWYLNRFSRKESSLLEHAFHLESVLNLREALQFKTEQDLIWQVFQNSLKLENQTDASIWKTLRLSAVDLDKTDLKVWRSIGKKTCDQFNTLRWVLNKPLGLLRESEAVSLLKGKPLSACMISLDENAKRFQKKEQAQWLSHFHASLSLKTLMMHAGVLREYFANQTLDDAFLKQVQVVLKNMSELPSKVTLKNWEDEGMPQTLTQLKKMMSHEKSHALETVFLEHSIWVWWQSMQSALQDWARVWKTQVSGFPMNVKARKEIDWDVLKTVCQSETGQYARFKRQFEKTIRLLPRESELQKHMRSDFETRLMPLKRACTYLYSAASIEITPVPLPTVRSWRIRFDDKTETYHNGPVLMRHMPQQGQSDSHLSVWVHWADDTESSWSGMGPWAWFHGLRKAHVMKIKKNTWRVDWPFKTEHGLKVLRLEMKGKMLGWFLKHQKKNRASLPEKSIPSNKREPSRMVRPFSFNHP